MHQVPSELQANMLGSGKAAAHIPFEDGRLADQYVQEGMNIFIMQAG